MLLRVPHWGFQGLGGYSMLGFGDVILPGLLVALARRCDADLRLAGARAYFPYLVLSYAVGLGLTYAALALSWFGDQGQPALLYLVPCTLGTVFGLGWARGQLGALWRGTSGEVAHGSVGGGRKEPLDHDSDAGEAHEGGAGRGQRAGGGAEEEDVEGGAGWGAGERARLLRAGQ